MGTNVRLDLDAHLVSNASEDMSACVYRAPPAGGDSHPMDLSEFDSGLQ